MACPLDATTGFLEITGPITLSQLKPIEINAAPLTFQFAPRAVPPTLVGNEVEENPQNTLLYKSIRYELIGVQLTAPTHTGYNSIAPFLGAPVFEVNLSFFSSQAPATYPALILLVVPVYTAQEQYHTAYFQQLFNTDLPAVSIESLFFDSPTDTMAKSFSYQTCIDLVGPGGDLPSSLQARVFVFPFGASIGQQEATTLYNTASAGSGNALSPYKLDKWLIGDYSTVLQYQVNEDGGKVPSETSAEGFLAQTLLSPVTDRFTNLLQYYTKPPLLAGTKALKDEQCGLPTEDYKCVPFNPTNDLSGNLVVLGQGQTLNQILQKQQSEQQMGAESTTLSRTARIVMIVIFSLIGLLIVGPLILYGLAKLLGWLWEIMGVDDIAAPAVATVATSAAAGLSAAAALSAAPAAAPAVTPAAAPAVTPAAAPAVTPAAAAQPPTSATPTNVNIKKAYEAL